MLYPFRHLLVTALAASLVVPGPLALAQARPPKTAVPPPAPVAEAPPSQGRCNEEDAGLSRLGRDMSALETTSGDPRAALQSLIDTTLTRSKALGAVRLLTDAARSDLEETRAMRLPTATLSLSANAADNNIGGVNAGRGGQYGATFSTSMPVWDFGRIQKLTEWRKELAEVALQGQRSAEDRPDTSRDHQGAKQFLIDITKPVVAIARHPAGKNPGRMHPAADYGRINANSQ